MATKTTKVTQKRKYVAENSSAPQPKKAKRDVLGDVTAKFTSQDLESFEKDDIVAHVLALQKHITELSESQSPPKQPMSPTPEQIKTKVELSRSLMISGFKSQMKVPLRVVGILWKKSLKGGGTAKLTYSAAVSDPAVFFALFNLPADSKKNQKVTKIPLEEFEKKVLGGRFWVPGPWGAQFGMAGVNVTVRWHEVDLLFTVAGNYSI